MVSYEADVRAQNVKGETPLHWLVQSTKCRHSDYLPDIAKLLLEAVADMNAKTNLGVPPLGLLRVGQTYCRDVVEFIPARGATGITSQLLIAIYITNGSSDIDRLCELGLPLPPDYLREDRKGSRRPLYQRRLRIWEQVTITILLCRAGMALTEGIEQHVHRILLTFVAEKSTTSKQLMYYFSEFFRLIKRYRALFSTHGENEIYVRSNYTVFP